MISTTNVCVSWAIYLSFKGSKLSLNRTFFRKIKLIFHLRNHILNTINVSVAWVIEIAYIIIMPDSTVLTVLASTNSYVVKVVSLKQSLSNYGLARNCHEVTNRLRLKTD